MKYFIKPTTQSGRTMNLAQRYFLPLCVAAFALAGCGGGASTGNTNTNPGGAVGGGTSTSSSALPTMVLTVTSLSGAALSGNAVTAGTTFQAKTIVQSSAGAAVVNQLVKFTVPTGSTLVTMSPPSGEVLTDSTGKASVNIIALAPSTGGAVVIAASATVGSVALTATGNGGVTIGQANITLGAVTIAPSAPTASALLPTNSTVALQVQVSSNGQPVNNASLSNFTVTSPCASLVPPQAEITPVGIVAGVLTVNYKNKGCAASPDLVTISMSGVNTPVTASLFTATSTPAELRYIGLTPTGNSLVVKGSAGLGRQESGTIRFRLLDNVGSGVGSRTVNFTLTTLAGGVSLGQTTPVSTTFSGQTDSSGYVEAPLFSGTIPTPVSVLASTVYNGVTLSAASSGLSVSVGVAEQRNFSFGPEKVNIEGWLIDGVTTDFTALLADLWGNSVADGTVVNMITEGGQIGAGSGAFCTTVNGACKLTFRTQNFRPRNGRASLVAYTPGIDSFDDSNGNGIHDNNEPTFNNGDPFIDYNENGTRSTGLLYSAGGANNLYPSSSEFYVSNTATYNPPLAPAPRATRQATTIFKQSTLIFSGPAQMLIQTFNNGSYLNPQGGTFPAYADITPPIGGTPENSNGSVYYGVYFQKITLDSWDSVLNSYDVDFRGNCQARNITFRITDENNNPVPAGSAVATDTPVNVTLGTVAPDKVNSTTAWGGTVHTVAVTPEAAKCGTSHDFIPAVPAVAAVLADPLANPPIAAVAAVPAMPAQPAIVVSGSFGVKVSTPGGTSTTFLVRVRY